MTKNKPYTDDMRLAVRSVDAGARLTRSMEDHVKAIFEVLEHDERATTSAVARRLRVASSSVTAMIRRLAALGLVTHEPYQGVQLTPVGRRTALEMIRHHRLLELYLARALGVPWDRVHDEAERLEHAISEDLEERIDAALGHPTEDPHGAPIPSREGTVARRVTFPLVDAGPGDCLVVSEVDDRSPELLRHLGSMGMTPGTLVEVVRVDPCDGPVFVRIGQRERAVGRAASCRIRVSRREENTA